jgi:hypothetical protein
VMRRALRLARRGANSIIKRPQPTTMAASMSKQAGPAWNTPWRAHAIGSAKDNHPWTTSRSS